jgi:hypothetical protein
LASCMTKKPHMFKLIISDDCVITNANHSKRVTSCPDNSTYDLSRREMIIVSRGTEIIDTIQIRKENYKLKTFYYMDLETFETDSIRELVLDLSNSPH